MKVVCDRGALLAALNLVGGVVAARTPRPQLTCVRISAQQDAGGGVVVLAATDGETALRYTLPDVEVARAGEGLVPAEKLRQIVSAEEHEPTLTIELEGDTAHIRGQDAHFRLLGFPVEEFPELPEFGRVLTGGGPFGTARAVFAVSADALAALIQRTLFATARENSRYAINGVLLKRQGRRVEMVATDGRRLALARDTIAGDEEPSSASAGSGPVACIIPTRALSLLLRLLDDPQEPVRIAVTDNQVLFRLGAHEGPERALVASNLVEGAFPPYEEVIPRDQDVRITIDRDVFSSAVRRAALLTNEESRGVRMRFIGADRRLELASRAPEMGEAEINVPLNDYQGRDLEIGFNPGFLTDALKVIADPEVILELKSPASPDQASTRPGLIRSGSDFQYVVMPINLH